MPRVFLAVLALASALSGPVWADPAMAETVTTSHASGWLYCAAQGAILLALAGVLLRIARWEAVFVGMAGIALMASACLAADSDGTRPDPVLTPGEIRTTDKAEICGHTTGEFRNVSVITKIAARRAYGIVGEHGGWCGADGCETDHRVPLTVGGGNTPGSIKNLWPQRPDGPHGFHVKDRCEAAVGRAICSGKISVADAQAIFLGDWTVGCAPYLKQTEGR